MKRISVRHAFVKFHTQSRKGEEMDLTSFLLGVLAVLGIEILFGLIRGYRDGRRAAATALW